MPGVPIPGRRPRDGSRQEGTLSPLVRRHEKQGLLTSEWRFDDKRKKRYYRLSALGEEVLASLIVEWRVLNDSIDAVLKEKK